MIVFRESQSNAANQYKLPVNSPLAMETKERMLLFIPPAFYRAPNPRVERSVSRFAGGEQMG